MKRSNRDSPDRIVRSKQATASTTAVNVIGRPEKAS
jgi:hypothetical protein